MCVAATIQSIGRCAATIEEVTDTCLNGLVHLLSNRDEAVVAESVVVIKRLLQTQVIFFFLNFEHIHGIFCNILIAPNTGWRSY